MNDDYLTTHEEFLGFMHWIIGQYQDGNRNLRATMLDIVTHLSHEDYDFIMEQVARKRNERKEIAYYASLLPTSFPKGGEEE